MRSKKKGNLTLCCFILYNNENKSDISLSSFIRVLLFFSDEFFKNSHHDYCNSDDHVTHNSYTIGTNTSKTMDIQYLAITWPSICTNKSYNWFDSFLT